MPSAASATLSLELSDSAGNTVALALIPGTTVSGMSSIATAPSTLAALLLAPGSASLESEAGSGNTATLACEAGASGQVTLQVTNFLSLSGALTASAQQVVATTSPEGGPTTVTYNLGAVSTVTPDPSNDNSTAFTAQGSSHRAEFYGMGVLRDAQSPDQQAAAAQCVVAIPGSTPGVNLVMCHIDAIILCKCTAGSALGPLATGAYYLQVGFTDWINNGGDLAPANLSSQGQNVPDFTTNPIWSKTAERGTVFETLSGYFYSIGPVTVIVTATSDAVVLSLLPSATPLFGTTVVEIFATATYN